MTERKRLHKTDPLAAEPQSEEAAVSHAPAPLRAAVPAVQSVAAPAVADVPLGRSPIDQLRRQHIRRTDTEVKPDKPAPLSPDRKAEIMHVGQKPDNPAPLSPDRKAEIMHAGQKPDKPAHLSSEQKLTNYFDVAGEDFRQHNADKLSKEVKDAAKTGGGESSRTATAESNDLAGQLFTMAKSSLAEVSGHVNKVTTDAGGKREGQDYALKDQDGLAGKIAEELAKLTKDGQDPKEAMQKLDVASVVGDALRFTIIYPFEGFTQKVLGAMSELEKLGYKAEKVGNTFKNPDAMYRGINTNWRAGKGIKWELQFHTDDSFVAKQKKNHGPYEGARILKDGDSRKGILEKQMKKVSAGIATPEQLDQVKAPVPAGIEAIKEK
ncbi:MAG: hypothetical protein QOE97_2331 [Pseudonocardiales bacterium]|jgi:hypothetical protein|nr:hypothetical protein [Pseudonocardiales bacterium]